MRAAWATGPSIALPFLNPLFIFVDFVQLLQVRLVLFQHGCGAAIIRAGEGKRRARGHFKYWKITDSLSESGGLFKNFGREGPPGELQAEHIGLASV